MCSEEPFLAVAASIGRRLVSDAVWHEGRCSWVGATDEPTVPQRAEFRALGPDLYGGTAGVGLFLARLCLATRQSSLRRTAVGALRHALGRAALSSPQHRDGFHAGALGVAWAAAEVAALLDDAELHAAARHVVFTVRPVPAPDRCPDLIMGSAGSIVALLALARALDEPALIGEAVAVGDDLLARATVGRYGWSWATPGRRSGHHLCGVSHGAAGIGWSLLELFYATEEERFRTAAAGAFAYERSWLDPTTGTWPDLRIGGQRRGEPHGIVQPGAGTWCHGEAGIALTRLSATAVLGAGPHRSDAEIAIESTQRHVARAMPFAIEDFSLCHGATGAADALLCGAAQLGERHRGAADTASDLGHVALERHLYTGEPWPCGTASGTTPGLFRGLSGIGWFFLRLHDAAIPSPLTLPLPH
jgi:lantibiotic modifying enzyme